MTSRLDLLPDEIVKMILDIAIAPVVLLQKVWRGATVRRRSYYYQTSSMTFRQKLAKMRKLFDGWGDEDLQARWRTRLRNEMLPKITLQ